MPLANDIRTLQLRALGDLAAAHDYYYDTKVAWKIVQEALKGGRQLKISNRTTRSTTTGKEVIVKARGYVTDQLAESTFAQFISIFEHGLFDLFRLWLCAFPHSLKSKTLSFEAVLEAPDKETITLQVVNHELNELNYERPQKWFDYLNKRFGVASPSADEIERFSEAKASRDIIVHNRGIANKVYLAKAGRLARFIEGEKLDIPEGYHRETWQLIRKILSDVLDSAADKAA